ncbi:hypothetical protein RGQ29_031785 [Quercus rubra]|uniref:F-box domain-containing protein n=1 Tax=Quercus rubra TaxID=3512 RepID=A0AAN7HRS6_QUERU|nr:hypothetical protein RGQ29_031785 [Quercus rubra]
MSDYLPDEVLIEILHRLSVKSLIRLRCVSKSWKSLIQLQQINCYRRQRLLIGSVNGLFCLFEDKRFILWNPYIRKFIILRKTYGPLTCRSGFGFDSRTNDYKVMRIAFPYNTKKCLSKKYNTNKFKEGRQPLVEVYSLKEGTRRKTSAGASLSPEIMFEFQYGWHTAVAFINGAVHFQVSCTDGLKVCPFVLSFDFSEEVALPKAKVRAENEFHIYGFRGSLSLVFNELVDNKRCYSIWVMKEYGIVKSWTELFTVDLSGYISRVFGFGRMAMYYLRNNGEEMIYQQVKKLGIPGCTVHFCTDNYVVENLVLLDKPNAVRSQWVVSRKRKFR